jgi:hypothetical protein
VVPGNSKYQYQITFLPIKASEINVDGWGCTPGGLATGMAHPLRNANGDWIGFTLTVTFPNKPDTDTITIKNLLKGQGAPNKDTDIISFKVIVVQVQVGAPPAPHIAFTPNPVPTLLGPGSADFGPDTNRAAVGIKTGNKKTNTPGLIFDAGITLNGPNGNQGVDKIEVGFIQHFAATVVIATYKPKEVLTAKYAGKPTSDYGFLDGDPTTIHTVPWYYTKEGALYNTATPASHTGEILANDSPQAAAPLTYGQDAFGVLATNDWPTLDLITKITYTEKFSLDVAARTTDDSNGASALYYAEASGD